MHPVHNDPNILTRQGQLENHRPQRYIHISKPIMPLSRRDRTLRATHEDIPQNVRPLSINVAQYWDSLSNTRRIKNKSSILVNIL